MKFGQLILSKIVETVATSCERGKEFPSQRKGLDPPLSPTLVTSRRHTTHDMTISRETCICVLFFFHFGIIILNSSDFLASVASLEQSRLSLAIHYT